jgi:hypothetical protein
MAPRILRQRLPTAYTHRLQAEAGLSSSHLMQKRRHDANACRADGMPESYARSVHIQPLIVLVSPVLQHRQDLTSECLIHFNQIHLRERHSRLCHEFGYRRHRTDAHDSRIASDCSPAGQDAKRFQVQFRQPLFGNYETRGGRIVLLRGISGCHDTACHQRPQFREARQA